MRGKNRHVDFTTRSSSYLTDTEQEVFFNEFDTLQYSLSFRFTINRYLRIIIITCQCMKCRSGDSFTMFMHDKM